MPLLPLPHDTGGWRAPRLRSLLLRCRSAAGFVAARSAPAAPAVVVLALFAAVGAAVLDDYGVALDESSSRDRGVVAIDHVLGGGPLTGQSNQGHNRFYGVSFEAPLVLAERLLGLTDSRAVFLLRHLLTHLFFLTGGFFCWLLALRLCGDRRLALFALLLYLLHPRLYAHSFFNPKDIPFLAMFTIALWLVERAFRRDTAAAFALCGAGVGVLVDLRVMGLALFAAVPGLRALDLLQAQDGAGRRRALATGAAFVLAAAGTRYAVAPWLWSDPSAIVDAFATLARHPTHLGTLFQGEEVRWPFIPPHYLPAWVAVTTPPAALLLSLAGAAAVAWRGVSRPRDVLRNTGLRFEWLLLACLVLPPAAVVALQSNLYDGWRQMYFLYAPLCLLAVCGLRGLLAATRRAGLRRAAGVLAAAALAGMAVDVVRLHPHQAAYFNFLVDRSTPERLRTQYEMLYWEAEQREGLEYLLARYPDATLYVDTVIYSRAILPAAARNRIVSAKEAGQAVNFFISTARRPRVPLPPSLGVLYARRIYGSTVLTVKAVELSRVDEAAADHARAAYRAAAAGEPLFRSAAFDLHLDGRTLTWVSASCRPEDTWQTFLLEVVPADPDDLPRLRRERGWLGRGFRFGRFGVRFDGRCLARYTLPDFPVRALRVGRWFLEDGQAPRREATTIDLSAGATPARSSLTTGSAEATGARRVPGRGPRSGQAAGCSCLHGRRARTAAPATQAGASRPSTARARFPDRRP